MRMPNPLRFTREECETVLENASSLMEALERLGLEETDRNGRPVSQANDSPYRH
jgi:hypothetical protein